MNLLDYQYGDFTVEEYGKDILRAQCRDFQHNLQSTVENRNAPFCLENTEEQAETAVWHANRWCRVTASIAKNIACVKTGFSGLLDSLLWSTQKKFIPALEYGKQNEGKAFETYAATNPAFEVSHTGLWLNRKYPQLACSPDGVVHDAQTGETGLLEIKCPFILKNYDPKSSKDVLTAKQKNNFCCSFDTNGDLKLKRSHTYYYQVQMQLAICEKAFCDFVVWSAHGHSVERISKDETMWKYMCPKLIKFHQEYLVPEFLGG